MDSLNVKNIKTTGGDLISIIMDTDTYLTADFNIEDLIYIIKKSIIRPCFRLFVLNIDETVNYEIPQEDILVGGSYSENYQNGQRRTLSFSLFNDTGKYTPSINNLWTETKVSLDLGIEMNNGETIWFKKGIYTITEISPSQTVDSKTLSIQMGDKFSVLEGKSGTLETTYEIPVGSDIQSIIKDILLSSKGNGHPFDTKGIIYHSSFKGKKTQVTISKSAGDTLGSIILELATQLSAEVFYNVEGRLVFVPIEETSIDIDKPLLFDFVDIEGDISELEFNLNFEEIINRVVVIGSSVNGSICNAIAVNANPVSPLSYQRIGYRTGSIINDSNITSEILAKERAEYELRKILILKSSTSLNVGFNPLLLVNNLVSLTNSFYELQKEKFLLQGISCSLDYTGTMSIQISNIKNLPFIT